MDQFKETNAVDRSAFFKARTKDFRVFWDVADIHTTATTMAEVADMYDQLADMSFASPPVTRLEKKLRLMLTHGTYFDLGGGDNYWERVMTKTGLSCDIAPSFIRDGRDWRHWWFEYKQIDAIVDWMIENGADFSKLEDKRVRGLSYSEWVEQKQSCFYPNTHAIPQDKRDAVDALVVQHRSRFGRVVHADSYGACKAAETILKFHPSMPTLAQILTGLFYTRKDDRWYTRNPVSVTEVLGNLFYPLDWDAWYAKFKASDAYTIHQERENRYQSYTFHSLTDDEVDRLAEFARPIVLIEHATNRLLFQGF
jgi:hypothetical protein